MIFLDANMFLRYLVLPSSSALEEQAQIASDLWEQVRAGLVQVTTSEAVLHEVCYVLNSRKQYALDVAKVVDLVSSLLMLEEVRFPQRDKSIYLKALGIWRSRPAIGFTDSVVIARCEMGNHELATFDGHFDRIPGLARWAPEPGAPTPG